MHDSDRSIARRRFLAGTAGLIALPGFARAQAPTIIMAGNGGAVGAMRLLAAAHEARHPNVGFRFLPNLGTSGGISAVLAGVVTIAMSARPLTAQEAAAGAEAAVYARTPLAFATHADVRLADIAKEDAKRIMAGQLATWPDGSPIRPIRRPHNDSMTQALADSSPGMRQAMDLLQRRPGIMTAANDQDNAEALESVRGAFGTITLAQQITERRRVNALSLNGTAASVAEMTAGTYALQTRLHLVTRGAPADHAGAFVEFVFGAAGAAILTDTGHEPLGVGA